MAPPHGIPDEVLNSAQHALRGAVAAEPGLLDDEARFRAAAGDAARAAAGDEATRESLERVLLGMRGQLEDAGS
jgi:hypothetical protein